MVSVKKNEYENEWLSDGLVIHTWLVSAAPSCVAFSIPFVLAGPTVGPDSQGCARYTCVCVWGGGGGYGCVHPYVCVCMCMSVCVCVPILNRMGEIIVILVRVWRSKAMWKFKRLLLVIEDECLFNSRA